jgi:hypothetical protein
VTVAPVEPDPQLTPEQVAALIALVDAQTRAYDQVQDALLETIRRLMGRLFNRWYFQREVDAVVRELADVVRDAQEIIGDQTEEYLDGIFDLLGVRKTRAGERMHVNLPPRLRDVDPLTEWNRPAREARVQRLFNGLDEFEANERAIQRAERQARMDLALARQQAERQRWGVSGDIIGFRRILHPELSESGPCGLCVVASSRTYRTSQLKDLHNGCVCTVFPIVKAGELILDPGRDLNKAELKRIYEAADGSTRRRELQRVRVKVLEHGELGPILVDARNKNRTTRKPTDLKSSKTDQELFEIHDRIVRDFERKVAAGTTPQFDIDYHRRIRASLAKKLGIRIFDDRAA